MKYITKGPSYWNSVQKTWTENLWHLALHETDIKKLWAEFSCGQHNTLQNNTRACHIWASTNQIVWIGLYERVCECTIANKGMIYTRKSWRKETGSRVLCDSSLQVPYWMNNREQGHACSVSATLPVRVVDVRRIIIPLFFWKTSLYVRCINRGHV